MTAPSKHTPGPWNAVHYEGPYWDIDGSGGARVVGDMGVEGESNAKLIAAAPELLEMLLEFIDGTEDVRDGSGTVDLQVSCRLVCDAKKLLKRLKDD